MTLCKYCLVCPRPCTDDCKHYVENKDFEYLEEQFKIYENKSNQKI